MYMAYLSESANEAAGSAVQLTASSEAAGYPVTNLLNKRPWRSTAVTSEWIELDLGSAKSIKFTLLRNHNLSATATIQIKGGAAANPSTVTETITWREFDAFKIFTSTHSYRYWRITFADTVNTYGFIQIGGVMIGVATVPTYHFNWGWRLIPEFNNRRIETSYLVPNIEELSRRHRLTMTFDLTDAEASALMTTLASLKQNVTPIFLIPRTTVADGYYGRFDPWEMQGNPSRQITLTFIEDGRGNLQSL